jgi:hypothetical protein
MTEPPLGAKRVTIIGGTPTVDTSERSLAGAWEPQILGLVGAFVSLIALAACMHDFDAFKIGDGGSGDDARQNTDAAAPDAATPSDAPSGCTPSLSCLNNARTCGTGCGSNAACRSNCVSTCVMCTQNFNCAAPLDCANAASP